ncbi:cytochrome P450 [Streptomyces sp. NPDC048639]|uniref:cytochrome P450 n=1 Tax=Streptomyces sp. NPDC048639 TaxID=3365581 RepID=UPI003721F576
MNAQPAHGQRPGAPEDPAAGCPVRAVGPGGLTRLYGPEASADPQGIYSRLRKQFGPVAPVLLEGDVHAWLVLGYRENRRVLDNPSQFSRDSRSWRDWKEGRIEETSPLVPMLVWRPDCLSQDGEPHRRLRGAVTDNLQRAASRGIRRHVTHFANKQISAFAADGHADLVPQFAEYLPMLVLTRLFGLPEDDGLRLATSCAKLIKGEDAVAHDGRIMQVLGELAERKRKEPGSDFTTGLLGHHAGLDESEIQSHLRLVLITAHTTTSNLLARVLERILIDPAHLTDLVSGQMSFSAVVEEVLWNTPPLAVDPGRFATTDTELGGQHIKAGDLLVLGLAAGNADPEVRPHSAVSVRGNQAHLAFAGGPHECPAQGIGQAIVETAVDVLLHRLPGLRLAIPPEELTSTASTWETRLDSLPVTFTPQPVTG